MYVMTITGLNRLKELEDLPEKHARAASMAVNATARRARGNAAERMLKQVAFPHNYLAEKAGRLKIARYASKDKLEATIEARDKPTSLSRFVRGGAKVRTKGSKAGPGLHVVVKPGFAQYMRSAFIMKLKNGNLGLAVRSDSAPRRGAKPLYAKKATKLWLLYGPSVDQVFKDVRGQIVDDAEMFMEREYERLVKVDL